jgi:hypothetical protein
MFTAVFLMTSPVVRHENDRQNVKIRSISARTERARGLPGSGRTDRHEAYNPLYSVAFAGLNNTRFVGVYFLNPPSPQGSAGSNPAPGTRVSSAASIGVGYDLIDQVAVNRVVDALVEAVTAMVQTFDSDEDC